MKPPDFKKQEQQKRTEKYKKSAEKVAEKKSLWDKIKDLLGMGPM